MSIISEHPQKGEIDCLIKSGEFSYRELEKELKTRFGLQISYKSIQQYHTKELGGMVDIKEGENGSGVAAIPIDMAKVEQTVNELLNDCGDSHVKRQTARLYAIQMQITEHALLQHTQGLARYPSEYVKNLNVLSAILTKK